MRIILMIDWFVYYAVELANALVEDHEVMLITRDHNFEISSPDNLINLDDFLDECLSEKITREKLRYRLRDLKNFVEIPRVYRKAKTFDPDVIHIQDNKDWRIIWIAKMLGFHKMVWTIHDVVSHPGYQAGILRYIKLIPRKRANKIIVHGEYLKELLSSKYKKFRNKIHVVPHGAFSIYKKWDDGSIQEEENTILFFGRISKYKGIDVLIKAFNIITKEIPEAKIVIAGRGEDFSKYEKLMFDKSRFEIHNRFISNAEVPQFFRRASVVVLPYTEASQSGVVPIAYVFGKPVVVTDVGSIPEVVDDGKTGFIVPPQNAEELAKAIVAILKNQELKRTMEKNALEKASTDLSWANVAKKTAEVYSLIRSND